MRQATPVFRPTPLFRIAPSGAIEWEELPSLADSLARRMTAPDDALDAKRAAVARAGAVAPLLQRSTPWDATLPAPLDMPARSEAFREPMAGMAVREVIEPDVFRHFFGS